MNNNESCLQSFQQCQCVVVSCLYHYKHTLAASFLNHQNPIASLSSLAAVLEDLSPLQWSLACFSALSGDPRNYSNASVSGPTLLSVFSLTSIEKQRYVPELLLCIPATVNVMPLTILCLQEAKSRWRMTSPWPPWSEGGAETKLLFACTYTNAEKLEKLNLNLCVGF